MAIRREPIAELRHEMQLSFARTDTRLAKLEGSLEAGLAKVDAQLAGFRGLFETGLAKADARLEKGLRDQTRFFFLAWAVQLAAIIGLYAR